MTPNLAQPETQRLQLSERVRQHSLHAFLEIEARVLQPGKPAAPRMRYYAKNGALDDLRRWAATPVNEELRRQRLIGSGSGPGPDTEPV